jgi:nucleoside-diphosphate-sugar epimerase
LQIYAEKMEIKRILITGANGFLGKTLLNELKTSHQINCLVRDRGFTDDKANVLYFQGYEDNAVEDAVSTTEAVVHCAAMLHGKKRAMYAANVLYTKLLLQYAEKYKIKHFIYISTENVEHAYSDNYTATKTMAEKEVKRFKNHTIFRPTILYGPGDKKYVSRLISLIKKLPVVPILGKGRNRFQFLYIDDLIQVITATLKRNITGTYVIAGPESVTYEDFMATVLQELGIKKPIIRIPIFLLKPIAYILDVFLPSPPLTPTQLNTLSEDRDYDIGDAVKLFKYTATPLEAGLKSLIAQDYYRIIK